MSIRTTYYEISGKDKSSFTSMEAVVDWFAPILRTKADLCFDRKDELLELLNSNKFVEAVDVYNESNAMKETIYIQGHTKLQV
jgi:hypothetical protein